LSISHFSGSSGLNTRRAVSFTKRVIENRSFHISTRWLATIEATGFEPGGTLPGVSNSSVQKVVLRSFCVRRSDDTDAQGDRSTLRSIRPTRATTSLSASVDPTDARKNMADDPVINRRG
jgi:hypothetical protein